MNELEKVVVEYAKQQESGAESFRRAVNIAALGERELREVLEQKYPFVFSGKRAPSWEPPEGLMPVDLARLLVELRFLQTSRKYKMFGRLPPGVDPVQLLVELELASTLKSLPLGHSAVRYWVEQASRPGRLSADGAARQVACCWSDRLPGCTFELGPDYISYNIETWHEYRNLGGGIWPWWL